MKDTPEIVKNILIDRLAVDASEIKPETTFEELGADSLDFVELIMEIENKFNIAIPDQDAEKLTTVAQLVEYLDRGSDA